MASVRFICGTQDLHTQLEQAISTFLGTEDTILYSSCFDANGGLFEVLLGEQDAVISDALNHASLIDGIRLCKATRFRYAHSDMADLEAKLRDATSYRLRLIATDGVFSMDGDLAKLDRIVELADRYDAAVIVDDSHATGVLGHNGRGTPDHFGVADRIEIVTSTLGKTLGGAAGGFTSGRKEIVELLRQRSRPYLFSNSLPPVIAAAARRAVILVAQGDQLRARLRENAVFFRAQLTALGFRLIPGEHPIIPIMLGDASLATRDGRAAFRGRDLCRGVQLPCCAGRPGTDSCADVGSPHARTACASQRCLRNSRSGTGRDSVKRLSGLSGLFGSSGCSRSQPDKPDQQDELNRPGFAIPESPLHASADRRCARRYRDPTSLPRLPGTFRDSETVH